MAWGICSLNYSSVSVIKYRVWVYTGKVRSAEPDPDVHIFLCLYGDKGDSGKRIISFMDSDQDEKFLEGQVNKNILLFALW